MTGASYPNHPGKHELQAIISPGASLRGAAGLMVPDAVVMTYQPYLLSVLESRGLAAVSGYPGNWGSVWLVPGGARPVAVVGGFGIGAPAAAIVLEELASLGASEFISIGTAGCLQPRCGFGEPVVCTGAIRDEGVSHHYLPPGKLARPSGPLTARFTAALAAGGQPPEAGLAWTIDAPYRETLAEARRYQSEGVLCVEMEAAALFAVGGYRGAGVAAGFAVSDHLLAGEEWTHAFGSTAVRDGLVRLLDAALLTLAAADRPADSPSG